MAAITISGAVEKKETNAAVTISGAMINQKSKNQMAAVTISGAMKKKQEDKKDKWQPLQY